MIGIDEDNGFIYEGSTALGRPIWPSQPFISIATLIQTPADYDKVPTHTSLGYAQLVFREDYFDPVTRVRRGRFYNGGGNTQPQEWRVPPHPAMSNQNRESSRDGLHQRRLFTFHKWPARVRVSENYAEVFAIGIQSAMTLWRIISIEHISTDEDLVTLKALSNMGVLPQLDESQVPESQRAQLVRLLSNVVDIAYRGGTESVIDRCRDLASSILGIAFDAQNKDLGDLASMARDKKKEVIANCASTIARLHARAKPSEQFSRGVAHPKDEDATLAMVCAGAILREIGWAKD